MTPAPDTTEADAGRGGDVTLLERVLYFVLLAVLCGRPLLSESFERLQVSFLPRTGGTTLAATVWLDSLTLTAAVAVLVRRRAGRRGPLWATLGVGLLMAAVAVSTLAAGDKRLALNAGFSLVISVLGGAALVRLMRAPWMSRLLLAALLATGCATAVKCFVQRTYEFDETLKYWNEHKREFVPDEMAPDDPLLVNFERRMQSREAMGYQFHPNVTGSLLMMWLLAAGGIGAGWIAGRPAGSRSDQAAALILALLVCATLAGAMVLTGSAGAGGSAAVGLLLLVGLGLWHRRNARRAGRATGLLAAAYLVVIAATLAYGLGQGTLPTASLAFRWHYWSAGIRAYQDAPLTGIGRDNFADAYLLHKPAESTEDVRDPHDLWISLLVELGPLGLLGGVVLVAGCMHAALRRLNHVAPGATERARVTVGQMAVAGLCVLVPQALLSGVVPDAGLLLLWVVDLAVVWVLALVLAVRLLDGLASSATGQVWLAAGLIAALAGALVHSLVDFALLTPAGLGVFVALAACLLARPAAEPQRAAPPPSKLAAVGGVLLVAAHLCLVTAPTMSTELHLARLNTLRLDPDDPRACLAVLDYAGAALRADPLDADAAREMARLAGSLSSNANLPTATRLELLRGAERFGELALRRDPRSSAAHTRLAGVYERMEALDLLDDADAARQALHKAAEHWQAAVALSPMDPRRQIAAGRAWFEWWEETDDPQAARYAAEHLAAAIRIDRTRQPGEVVALRPAEWAEISSRLRALEAAGFGVPTASAPATAPATAPVSGPTTGPATAPGP